MQSKMILPDHSQVRVTYCNSHTFTGTLMQLAVGIWNPDSTMHYLNLGGGGNEHKGC